MTPMRGDAIICRSTARVTPIGNPARRSVSRALNPARNRASSTRPCNPSFVVRDIRTVLIELHHMIKC